MDVWRFSFITLSMTVLLWSALPPVWMLPPVFILAIILAVYYQRWWLSGALTAIFWMASVGHWQQAWQLPQQKIQQTVIIEGRVLTLTRPQPIQRFNLYLSKLDSLPVSTGTIVRLSYRQPHWDIKQGQRVRLAVRLKPPHGSLNLGGFNYQRWLFTNGVKATGYVVTDPVNELLHNNVSLRQQILDKMQRMALPNSAWIQALTLGYRGGLEQSDWQLVQRTGIAHLIAISGLHLGIISGLSLALLLWSFGLFVSGQSSKVNLLKLGMAGALITGFGYAALAGFSLPTARAWIMLSVVTGLWLTDRHWRPRQIFLSTLLVFILLFPVSVLSLSFWLSFSAIMIVWLVFWRWPVVKAGLDWRTAFISLLRMQLALSLLMLPLVAWQFHLVSLISPLVNILAVPLVTLLLVPLCLLGLILLFIWPGAATLIFGLADKLIEFGIEALQWSLTLMPGFLQIKAIPLSVWLLFVMAVVAVSLPVSRLRWMFALVLCLPLLSWTLPSRDPDWYIRVLDVGQGLSVVIERRGRAILYDTGPAYPSGYNSADSHILPLLKTRGITQIDKLFISHHDNDHAGSLAQLKQRINVKRVIDSDTLCRRGWRQQWQGLELQVLWPVADSGGTQRADYSENNLSCVLKISDRRHSVLLPGDIDRDIERILLGSETVAADILIAPHHGSNTSSSSEFISAVNPDYVVFSQGYLNRWRFPAQQVIQRYQQQGVTLLQTSKEGQVDFIVSKQQISVKTYRRDYHPYWYQRPPFHF